MTYRLVLYPPGMDHFTLLSHVEAASPEEAIIKAFLQRPGRPAIPPDYVVQLQKRDPDEGVWVAVHEEKAGVLGFPIA